MRSARWSGLDGLRAVAVTAVLVFHFAPGVLPGGFLGVDVFFAISGYLITRLLVEEISERGRLDFTAFYVRRARRLLPGLAALLIAVSCAALVWRDELRTVRSAVGAAALYVSNWWQAWSHQSYFVQTGRPGMLQHLWSLGIEEQFYLLWPAVVAFVLARWSQRRLAVLATVLALASAGWMAALAVAHNVPYQDDGSRLYYGTDTHSAGLLVGAAVGALAANRARRASVRSDLLALVALALLVRMLFTVDQFSLALYRGGFLVVGILATAVVGTVTLPGSRLGRLLDARPLAAVGRRSYGIYLWHWPVAVVTRPGFDLHLPSFAVFVLRIAVTLGLSEASYRWIELPVRRVGLRAAVQAVRFRWRQLRSGHGHGRWVAASTALVVLAAALVLLGVPRPPESQAARVLAAAGGRSLSLGGPSATRGGRAPAPSSTTTPASPPVSYPGAPWAGSAQRTAPPAASPATLPALAAGLPPLSGFGDSVILGARFALQRRFGGGTLDAVEGRQAGPVLADVRARAAAGRLEPLVVIHVGDNGLIDPADLRATLRALHAVPLVLVVTVRVSRAWEEPVNDTIRAVVPHFANARVVDWHQYSAGHSSWFYEDGLHVTPLGARKYAGMLARAVRTVQLRRPR